MCIRMPPLPTQWEGNAPFFGGASQDAGAWNGFRFQNIADGDLVKERWQRGCTPFEQPRRIVKLYNAVGQLIWTETCNDNHVIIPMQDLPNGIYFVQSCSSTCKVVKQ